MVSSLIHWLTFKVVIQWALAKPVTYVSNMDTNSFQDSPGRIDNVVGREVNPVLDPRCGDGSKPRVKFTRRLGQKAIDAFCDGIAGKGPNPWHYTEEYDKYGVTLRPTMQRFGTSHHFDETIFDFEVSSLAKSSKEFPFKEGSSPSYYHDCKGALKNLTSSCRSPRNFS